MKGRRVVRSYSLQEKKEALRQLALNGNLSKTAQATGIPIPTLYRWRDEESQDSMDPQAKNLEKFVKNAWKNIHSLNSPKFVKDLKVQALKKGHLKEVFTSISILVDKMTILARLQVQSSKKAKSDELLKNLTLEEIDNLIAEEEKKERERKAGGDKGEV